MWLFVAAFITFAILAAIFRDAILLYIDPRRDAILSTPFSWLVPVAVLIAVEFPPLAGHSAIAVATGAIWGFKLGILIVCAGTLVGEILCFGAFSTFLRAKAERCVGAGLVLFLSLVDSLLDSTTHACHRDVRRIEQKKPLYSHLARSVRGASVVECAQASSTPCQREPRSSSRTAAARSSKPETDSLTACLLQCRLLAPLGAARSGHDGGRCDHRHPFLALLGGSVRLSFLSAAFFYRHIFNAL